MRTEAVMTGICLEELRKTIQKLSQSSQPLGQDLNLTSQEYKAGMPTSLLTFYLQEYTATKMRTALLT